VRARKSFQVAHTIGYGSWAVPFLPSPYVKNSTSDSRRRTREEGAIPIPDSLVELLRARRHRSQLAVHLPNGHLLRILKPLGKRAGLNCGHGYNRAGLPCSKHAVCSRFELHRLGKTLATMHHEAACQRGTIQRWLRHSSLDTTLSLLRRPVRAHTTSPSAHASRSTAPSPCSPRLEVRRDTRLHAGGHRPDRSPARRFGGIVVAQAAKVLFLGREPRALGWREGGR
jgi:hypothetical protein